MASPSTLRSTNQLDALPLVASAVVIPTTVAPTVGQRTSGLRSAARPYSPATRPIATGRLVATGSIFHIQPSSFVPASAPIVQAVMLPIGRINLYVGFTGSYDPADPMPRSTPLGSHAYDGRDYSFDYNDYFEPADAHTELSPSSVEGQIQPDDLEDDADSAALLPATRIEKTPVSESGSIIADSVYDLITLVSNASDYAESIRLLLEEESGADSTDFSFEVLPPPVHVYMAGPGTSDGEVDPFSTPLSNNATAAEIDARRQELEDARKKELAERSRFRLEREAAANVSRYRERRAQQRRTEDLDIARNLNFDNAGDPTRPPPGATAAPGGQPHVGRRGNGPPPQPQPNQERPPPPEPEVDPVTNLPLYSTPMDNVLAMQAAIANLDPVGEHADQINYAKALLNKAMEQQAAASDSRSRIYSRTSSSRAASSARRAAERSIANRQHNPPLEPQLRITAPAHSTNEPRPVRRDVAANGEPIDARQHIDNVQQWRAQQPHDLRHSLDQNRQALDSYNSHPPEGTGSLTRPWSGAKGTRSRSGHLRRSKNTT